jgi:hypothetical protein
LIAAFERKAENTFQARPMAEFDPKEKLLTVWSAGDVEAGFGALWRPCFCSYQ